MMAEILMAAAALRGSFRGETRKGLIFRLIAAGLAATSLAGCLGYDGVINRGAVYDQRKLAQVKQGMPAPQVLTVLGTPSTTSTVGGDAWYYVSQRTERTLAFMQPQVTDQHVTAVYFDKDKKVQRIADYGLEDGKAIDFVTRSTPTPGAENNLVTGMLKAVSSISPF
jgi:outer membrane protein assembly factor BamE (lipoprotein component of BamABCDE complex)